MIKKSYKKSRSNTIYNTIILDILEVLLKERKLRVFLYIGAVVVELNGMNFLSASASLHSIKFNMQTFQQCC